MKKTLVDLTYYSFSEANSQSIISKCQSTIGFLENLTGKFAVHFVVRSKNEFPSLDQHSVQYHFFKGRTLNKWQIPFRFSSYIKSWQPDYILVHGFGAAHYLILLKIMCPKSKILLQSNGFSPPPKRLKKLVYKISDYFIDGYLFTGSENAEAWYEAKVFRKSKVFEVMEGSTHFKFNGNTNRNQNSFIWVGRLDKNKDPITILNAFDLFLEVESTAKLTMIFHEGELLDVVTQRVSNSENLKKAVELRGFVEHQELETIYHNYQYFILGSHYEGSGYALLEAMACGCVPIVTNIPSFKYMTANGRCGFLFSPKKEEELLAQLKKTIVINYKEHQQKVIDQFNDKLAFQAIANEIELVFQSL
ncbi:glycosyltransferase family 4 protein [Flavobacterium sp. IMCC34852]|uniref:Glycosyltransferase family 4 protein n=1 Tax=Flavobacterium rivulicola TaxID=2732161 RepID=A0A7Y3VY99_9FLAO|nr:glycosyltransferase family 4 protein [Flavobacterium sp. IMCC34852]NNT71327.1 glycosyltransferase family 4 protein [Flavobacterium sp. IMCC34852]